MRIQWCEDAISFDTHAAGFVLDLLAGRPEAVVALPTGGTPAGMYARLRAAGAVNPALFSRARWFDLDEYVGLGASHPLSFAHFLHVHLFDAIAPQPAQVRLLRGNAADIETECRDYDQAIESAGGLDLAILGLGANGHIAFNEPGSPWHLTTHGVELSEQTRAANAAWLRTTEDIPGLGLTMSIATLRQARNILLLVSGDSKRWALQSLLAGVEDPAWPVTSLIGHPRLTVVASAQLRSVGD